MSISRPLLGNILYLALFFHSFWRRSKSTEQMSHKITYEKWMLCIITIRKYLTKSSFSSSHSHINLILLSTIIQSLWNSLNSSAQRDLFWIRGQISITWWANLTWQLHMQMGGSLVNSFSSETKRDKCLYSIFHFMHE